jgi:hypothetical protein
MDPARRVPPGAYLPVELVEGIVKAAWLSRSFGPSTRLTDHYALYNTLSVVSKDIRIFIVHTAWLYVFIGHRTDIVRYLHLYYGAAAVMVADLGHHREVHFNKGWLVSFDVLMIHAKANRDDVYGRDQHMKEAFIRILKASPVPGAQGVVSIRDREGSPSPEIHLWNGHVNDILRIHAYDQIASQELRQLWLHHAFVSDGDYDQHWRTSPSPCKRLLHLRAFMNTGSCATWGKFRTPFNAMYPNMQTLELNHSTSLLPVFPLLPRTLKTLVLDVPIVPGAPTGTVYFWSLARSFRECACLRSEWNPKIVLRTGRQEPTGWSEALAAATMIGVILERIVVF